MTIKHLSVNYAANKQDDTFETIKILDLKNTSYLIRYVNFIEDYENNLFRCWNL